MILLRRLYARLRARHSETRKLNNLDLMFTILIHFVIWHERELRQKCIVVALRPSPLCRARLLKVTGRLWGILNEGTFRLRHFIPFNCEICIISSGQAPRGDRANGFFSCLLHFSGESFN